MYYHRGPSRSPEQFPELPADVCRQILEIAATCDQKDALTLVQVSKTVCSWVDPILFRSILVLDRKSSFPLLLQTLASRTKRNPALATAHIQNLCIWISVSTSAIFPFCTSISRLWVIGGEVSLLERFGRIQPKHVTFWRFCDIQVDFSAALYEHMTHLDLGLVILSSNVALPLPPSLTHLAFSFTARFRTLALPLLEKMAIELPRLTLVVISLIDIHGSEHYPDAPLWRHFDRFIGDKRVYLRVRERSTLEDFNAAAKGALDLWEKAQASVDAGSGWEFCEAVALLIQFNP